MRKSIVTAIAALTLLGACAQPAPKPEASAGTVTLAQAADARVTARGTFVGKSKHVTTGHASIGRVGKQWVVILEDDFTFDGAPDPHVALGNNGYDKNASLALLSSNNGKQVYAIPASLDVGKVNEVWIWCERFAVPLGLAKLN